MKKTNQTITKPEKTKEKGLATEKKRIPMGFIATLIGLSVVTVALVILAITIKPIMSPVAQVQATAFAVTKTAAYETGAYVDPELLIEPLPVENVSGIVVLGGLMVLIVLGVVLREFVLWQKTEQK